MKKILVLVGIAALAFWLVKSRLGGEPDEFVFTEAPPVGDVEASADAPPEAPPAG
jgi:hypothetical protein